MNITKALILRLAKMPAKDQKNVLTENPTTNYSLLIQKCTELSELYKDDKSGLAEKIENLKFTAHCFLINQQKGIGTAELVTTHET